MAVNVAIMMNDETLCILKDGKLVKRRVQKRPSKKLEKYVNNTAAKAPNGEILKETVLHDMKTSKSAPFKGYSWVEEVDVNKEFQKALDKGKKYGMHLSNKGGDPFLSEIEKSLSYDPLKGKI